MAATTRVRLGRREDLGADCANCFGLCCVALAFTRSTHFAFDKPAGDPSTHLDDAYACRIHPRLRDRGFKGCTVFDCFGAGQKVSRGTFEGRSWRDDPGTRAAMFAAFPVVRRLHELLWYLDQAIMLVEPTHDPAAWLDAFEHIRRLSDQPAGQLAALNVDAQYDASRDLLVEASAIARSGVEPAKHSRRGRALGPGSDLIGARLSGADLRGVNLRGGIAIAADLTGAQLRRCDVLGVDLRDADLAGAYLDGAIFLTQMQVNGARGDARTVLPEGFERPSHWRAGRWAHRTLPYRRGTDLDASAPQTQAAGGGVGRALAGDSPDQKRSVQGRDDHVRPLDPRGGVSGKTAGDPGRPGGDEPRCGCSSRSSLPERPGNAYCPGGKDRSPPAGKALMQIEIEAVTPLRFPDGSPVRAASAVARLGDGQLIAQDDATHAAWLRGDTVTAVRLLPPVEGLDVFDEASGTKHLKPDLEAACEVTVDGTEAVLLLGSGSSEVRMRSSLVHLDGDEPRVVVTDLSPLYASVVEALGIEADQLNMEGACVVGNRLRWFHRGLPSAGLPTASVDLDLQRLLSTVTDGADAWTVPVGAARHYDLGNVQGVGLAVTDAVFLDEEAVLVSAAAEDAPNPRDDGPVVGSALALLSDDEVLDMAVLPDVDGQVPKVEGLSILDRDDSGARVLATVDADDPEVCSMAVHLRVRW